MVKRIFIAGFGGQGVLLIGQMLAYAAMFEDQEVSWMPSYGPEMRGGTANCTVNISHEPIASPLVTECDVLITMNGPSLDKFESMLVPGGDLFINSSIISQKVTRDDINVHYVDCQALAEQEVGSAKTQNMVMLGAIIQVTNVVNYAAVVPHQAEVIFRQRFEIDDKELEKRIESYYDGENLFRSIKIHGDFARMHVRMIPKSTTERKFTEVAVNQPEYCKENITGTIVGIWTPEIFHGVSLAGYHLHFVSDDLTFGGHVMDFVIKEGVVELGAVDQLDQRFPVQDRKYLFAKFNMDEMKEDMEKSE